MKKYIEIHNVYKESIENIDNLPKEVQDTILSTMDELQSVIDLFKAFKDDEPFMKEFIKKAIDDLYSHSAPKSVMGMSLIHYQLEINDNEWSNILAEKFKQAIHDNIDYLLSNIDFERDGDLIIIKNKK